MCWLRLKGAFGISVLAGQVLQTEMNNVRKLLEQSPEYAVQDYFLRPRGEIYKMGGFRLGHGDGRSTVTMPHQCDGHIDMHG